MPHIDADYKSSLSRYEFAEVKRLEFFPDTIPYTHTENEYVRAWQKINDETKGNYLYVDNYQIKRVGFFRNAWENFRGFFGFENHCHPSRINMTLQKFAYYGYVHCYNQSALQQIAQWQNKDYYLSSSYIRHSISPRAHAHSAALQTQLLTYYRKHSQALRPSFWHRYFSLNSDSHSHANSSEFKFGQSLKILSLKLLLALDPQDEKIIKRTVADFFRDRSRYRLHEEFIVSNTKLAQIYANDLIMALIEKDSREESRISRFIDYAYSFIMPSTIFPEDTTLALKLDKDIINRYPSYFFSWYIKQESITEAKFIYDQFKDNGTICFKEESVNQLAAYLSKQSDMLLAQSKLLRESDNWQAAELDINKSEKLIHVVGQLNPNYLPYQLAIYKRDYQVAKLIMLSPLHGDQRSNRLNQAILKLEPAHKHFEAIVITRQNRQEIEKNKKRIKTHLIQALHECADLAVAKCLIEDDGNDGACASEEHTQQAKKYINEALKCFNRIIQLKPDDKALLAKAHFMLADLENYFLENSSIENYRKAMELMPNNPFYILAYATKVKTQEASELKDKGLALLRAENLDYYIWHELRWTNKPLAKDVHSYEAEQVNNRSLPYFSYFKK